MSESPMRRRLRYQRRYTELVRAAVRDAGVDPQSAGRKATEQLRAEWIKEHPDQPIPSWAPFGETAS
jgi:hypothetical protein